MAHAARIRAAAAGARRIAGASRRRHLAAEAGGKHVPWGVAGEGTYTASTKGCFDVIARCGPLGEAAAMADDMFAKYVDLVAEDPAQHAMDYVHSYAHAEKA